MPAYLVDTNHLSVMVTEHHPLRHRILRQIQLGDVFAVAPPVLTETLYGLQTIPRAQQNMAEWTRLSVMFGHYTLDQQDAERAAFLQVQLRRRGWQLGTVDALIATVALRYTLTLLTAGRDFSQVPGLVQENWLIQTGNGHG